MNSSEDEELLQLVEALCESSLHPDKEARLRELVCGDDEAAWLYLCWMQQQAFLERESQGIPLDLLARLPESMMAKIAGEIPDARHPQPADISPLGGVDFSWSYPWLRLLAVILLITAAGLLGFWWNKSLNGSRSDAPVAIGRVTRTIDCRWGECKGPTQRKADVFAGEKIQLHQGLAEITLSSGVRLTLCGSTTLEVTSLNSVVLPDGDLTTYVPDNAIGFTVQTPAVDIIDQGTEFLARVAGGRITVVQVLEGEVKLAATDRRLQLPKTRGEGQAPLRIDAELAQVEELPQANRFPFEAGPRNATLRHELFDSFSRDNIDPKKWEVILPDRRASLGVVDGRVKLTGRAYLATARPFDPVAGGGLRVTGTWQFGGTQLDNPEKFDLLTILTRCNAEPDPTNSYEATSGIRFRWDSRYAKPAISVKGPDLQITHCVHVGRLKIEPQHAYRFEIIDDGKNLSFLLTQSDNPSNVAAVTASVLRDTSKANRVVFYNREGRHTAFLDDVRIATGAVPERDLANPNKRGEGK